MYLCIRGFVMYLCVRCHVLCVRGHVFVREGFRHVVVC